MGKLQQAQYVKQSIQWIFFSWWLVSRIDVYSLKFLLGNKFISLHIFFSSEDVDT